MTLANATQVDQPLFAEGRSVTHQRAMMGGVALAALGSAAMVWWPTGSLALAGGFGAAAIAVGGGLWAYRQSRGAALAAVQDAHLQAGEQPTDWALVRAIADQAGEPIAVTDRSGRLVCANAVFLDWFGGVLTPPNLPVEDSVNRSMAVAGRDAWAMGEAVIPPFSVGDARYAGQIKRVGRGDDHLLWRWHAARDMAGPEALAERISPALSSDLGMALGRSGVMAAVVNATGVVQSANAAFVLRALGDKDHELGGQELATLFAVDQHGLIRFAREQGQDAATPLRLIEIALSEASNSPFLMVAIDEDGGPAERGIALDYVEALLAGLTTGVAMIDRDGRLLFANPSFLSAMAVTELPRFPTDLVVGEDKSALGDAIRRQAAVASGKSEMTVRVAAGEGNRPLTVTLGSVRGIGDAAVLLSIQSSKNEDELKAQVAQAQKMQAVGQLAGGIAHDFNNILTGILGSCDLMLLRHTPGDSDYDDIQQIRSNTNRAANLTRQLLAFSRQQTLRPQIVNMADVIADVSHLLQRLIGEVIKLEVHHGRGLGTVRADPGQLEQVIVNLAVNARDAMPRGGTLTLSTMPIAVGVDDHEHSDLIPPGAYACLRVRDTGQGIAPDVLPKIFDPFFTTKPVGQGTGLGLATVYGIVKQSGGFIFADSTVGRGTEFSVYLPVVEGAVSAASMDTAPPVARSMQWGSGTILLVEDEDVVRAVAERALSRAGYRVITAVDGADGLTKFAENPGIDLIISDVMMPEMDGPTMAARIREERGDLPVLFMSGYAEEQLRNSISMPNVGFLPKPFAVAQLIEAVAAVHSE